MYEKNLDHEILKLIEAQPEISDRDIACNLSVPEELVKIRIANFNDTREKILIMGNGRSIYDSLRWRLKLKIIMLLKLPGGSSALETVKSEKPDLVLLDTGLADIDGFEICRQLESQFQVLVDTSNDAQ